MWPAVQHQTTVHDKHNHKLNHVAGVLFLRDVPGAPALHLFDPRPRRIDWHAPRGAEPIATVVDAKPGELVLFPPWLDHSVKQPKNRSEHEAASGAQRARITIPFNVHVVKSMAKVDPKWRPECLDCNVAAFASQKKANKKERNNEDL